MSCKQKGIQQMFAEALPYTQPCLGATFLFGRVRGRQLNGQEQIRERKRQATWWRKVGVNMEQAPGR